jgi:hypothetical protein
MPGENGAKLAKDFGQTPVCDIQEARNGSFPKYLANLECSLKNAQGPAPPTWSKLTYRIQGLPASSTSETAKTLIESSPLFKAKKTLQVRVLSLAPSPYNNGTNTTLTATIIIKQDSTSPFSIEAGKKNLLSEEFSGDELEGVEIDSNFWGFTPLNSIDSNDHKIE